MNVATSPMENWDWISAQIGRIASNIDAYEFLKFVSDGSRFRHFTVLRFTSDPDARLSRQVVFTSLPQHVVRDYEEEGLSSDAGTLTVARRSVSPYLWGGDNRANALGGADTTKARGILAKVGISMGLSVPVQTWRAIRGLVLFGGERKNPDLGEVGRLSLISNCVFDQLVRSTGEEAPAQDFRLSGRERQCLMWTSAGKTSAEIAVILGLSEHTVNQYITTSCQKLGAVNRTHAVAKAIRLRLIE